MADQELQWGARGVTHYRLQVAWFLAGNRWAESPTVLEAPKFLAVVFQVAIAQGKAGLTASLERVAAESAADIQVSQGSRQWAALAKGRAAPRCPAAVLQADFAPDEAESMASQQWADSQDNPATMEADILVDRECRQWVAWAKGLEVH